MLKKFYVRNYKNLKLNGTLSFGSINFFLGDLNSGKSNLMESISFLKDLMSRGLNFAIKQRKYSNVLNRFSEREELNFKWVMNTGEGYPDLAFELEVKIPRKRITEIVIRREILRYDKPKRAEKEPFRFIKCHDPYKGECEFPLKRNNKVLCERFMVSNKMSVFEQLDTVIKDIRKEKDTYPMFIDVVDALKDYVCKWLRYSFLSDRCGESYSDYDPFDFCIQHDARNIANIIRNIESETPGFCDNLIDEIQKIYPNIEKLYPVVDGDKVKLLAKINGKKFYFGELSEGLRRIILMVTFFLCPTGAKLLLMENPEAGFQPDVLKVIAEWIKKTSEKKQIFIVTSSMYLLKYLKENHNLKPSIKVFTMKDGTPEERAFQEFIKDMVHEKEGV